MSSSETKPRSAGLVSQRKFMLKHNIASVSSDRVEASSLFPNRGDRTVNFFIPKTSNRLVNLSGIALHLKVRLVNGLDGKPLDPQYKYFIPGFAPATIFGSVAIRINDTEVTNAAQHPLLSKFLFLTRVEPERRGLLQEVNDWDAQYDEENLSARMVEVSDGEETDDDAPAPEDASPKKKKKKTKKVKEWLVNAGRFPGANNRSKMFTREEGRGTVTYSTFLLTELTAGGGDKELILPPCDLAIDFYPADPSRAILTTDPKPETRVEIVSAHLSVPRIQPKAERIPSLRWNFLRTRINPLIVPKDRMEFHAVVLYSGLIGRRISIFVLDSSNWEGTYRNSLYRSYHNHLESVELRLGSRVIPTSRIKADFENNETGEFYLHVRESLKHSLRRTGALDMVSHDKWSKGGFIWSADTTIDQSADLGFRGTPETGSVNLSLSFGKRTSEQLVLVLVLESTAELSVSASGEVNVSD